MSTVDQRNAETSRREVEAFTAESPDRYFAYQDSGGRGRLMLGDHITTWTGDRLATITAVGQDFRSNFGDKRQAFEARAINGATYSGIAYLSAGDYVRMRRRKGAR